jgi:hypothetical protein
MADNVIDFNKKRQDSIEKRKKSFERVLFRDFLGSYAEIDENGTKFSVELVDISHGGCLFQIPYTDAVRDYFTDGKNITLRVYFTDEDFLPVSVDIRHGNEYVNERGDAYMRYGGAFDQSLPSFEAFKHFINFIYKFAEYSCLDKGESKVYFL